MRPWVKREADLGSAFIRVWGWGVRVSRVHYFFNGHLAMSVGIRVQEEWDHSRSQLIKYPGLSTKGILKGGGNSSLAGCFAGNCVIQLHYVYSSWRSFEIDALRLKNLLSGTYSTISKELIREVHRFTCKNI